MHRGFTLLEVMVAGAILAIGALGVLGMLVTVIGNNRASRDHAIAVTIAESRLLLLQANDGMILSAMDDGIAVTQNSSDPLSKLTGVTANTWVNPFTASAEPADGEKPLLVNHYGDDCASHSDADGCKASDRRFAVAVRSFQAAADSYSDDYVRGEIRVLWSARGGKCNEIADFGKTDSLTGRVSDSLRGCDFVSIPFAMHKPQAAAAAPSP